MSVICVFLMANYIKHIFLFGYLFVLSSEIPGHVFRPLHSLIRFCQSLCILHTSPLVDIWSVSIFPFCSLFFQSFTTYFHSTNDFHSGEEQLKKRTLALYSEHIWFCPPQPHPPSSFRLVLTFVKSFFYFELVFVRCEVQYWI